MGRSKQLPIFVYGTLQRGECREACWPHRPAAVIPGTVEAALYDLGAYPGIVAGEDTVEGELWFIAANQLDRTLRVLDQVEGCRENESDSLYTRVMVTCRDEAGNPQLAYAYFYARSLAGQRRIPANDQGRCRWRGQPT